MANKKKTNKKTNKKAKAFSKGLGSPDLSRTTVKAGQELKKEKQRKAEGKPPRARKRSDDIYNARRRWTRAAERYMKKAETAKGVEKARYQRLAAAQIEKSLMTYQKEPLGKTAELAEKLGVTKAGAMATAFAKGFTGSKSLTREQIMKVTEWSMKALSGNKKDRRDAMAKEILKIDNIGSRFYGGLVDVWGGSEDTRQHPNQAILDYFGADSVMDVLESLEAAGIDIYTPIDNDSTYKSIQLRIQEYILANRNG